MKQPASKTKVASRTQAGTTAKQWVQTAITLKKLAAEKPERAAELEEMSRMAAATARLKSDQAMRR